MSTFSPEFRFFLGGRDLEMETIAALLFEAGLGDRVVDGGLAWGARAGAYDGAIRTALAAGETPVLIELADDLAADIDRSRLVVIDHHGSRAGHGRPTSLEQIFALVGRAAGLVWTRRRALVAANDRGHAAAMRAIGAQPDEIREIRDADRLAQGVSAEVAAESRRAVSAAKALGPLLVVETRATTSSAVHDFLLPEYGGPDPSDVLVTTALTWSFSGEGRVIADLSTIPGCWYGGDLPSRGFWGAARDAIGREALTTRILAVLRSDPSPDVLFR